MFALAVKVMVPLSPLSVVGGLGAPTATYVLWSHPIPPPGPMGTAVAEKIGPIWLELRRNEESGLEVEVGLTA